MVFEQSSSEREEGANLLTGAAEEVAVGWFAVGCHVPAKLLLLKEVA